MFAGTGSDVGKSVMNTAFCRIFLQDGYAPAPFKAQNMSLNSYASKEGLELGRAQAVQAEACGIPCLSAMNPILLKPTSDRKAQVILHGKPVGDLSAHEYFLKTDREFLFAEAMKAWHSLNEKYNPVVMEGAGAERDLVKGILINKFRGDIGLFSDGRKKLEELTGIPVIGVIPYFSDIYIDQEDSVVLDRKRGSRAGHQINVAVVLLRHMSNFTDFSRLERIPGVNLYYSARPEEIAKADIVLIPGSKNTIADLMDLRRRGLAKAVLQAYENGKAVYGICGGYQILGKEIRDPDRVEGLIPVMPGLGLLPVITTLTREKQTVQARFRFRNREERCEGYEIHMGETELSGGEPLCITETGKPDGCYVSSRLWGTYLHGILDNQPVLEEILKVNQLKADVPEFDYSAFKEEQYDKLAALVRRHVNMSDLYAVMKADQLPEQG